MIRPRNTAFIVDDDASILKALARMLKSAGCECRTFLSAETFLDAHDVNVPGCAVFDINMPGIDGLTLQEKLTCDGTARPIVFLTGYGDIPSSVRAMRAGAIDFLTKPVDRKQLLFSIDRAFEIDANQRAERSNREEIASRLAKLTPREHEVLTHVVSGQLNKQIAADLGTVEKTIKVHRGRMMSKLGVRSVAELVRLTERLSAHMTH